MTQEAIRALLRANPDGMTANALQNMLNHRSNDCKRIAGTMPDVFIARWEMSSRKGVGYAPVYIAVVVPEDAPRPD